MGERGPGLVGGIAAGRPLLAAVILSFGVAALSAVGFQKATTSYNDMSLAMLASLALMMTGPAAVASLAPQNFWLRALLAAFAAGLILALRRFLLQTGITFSPFNEGIALAGAATITFFLTLAAPLWRSALSLSLIGLAAVILAAAGGLAVIALETAEAGVIPTVGASLALAVGFGAALSIQIAAAFSRSFAEGGDNSSAAAAAARYAAAPALFALGAGVAAIGVVEFASGAAAASIAASVRVAAMAIAFGAATPLFMLAGALSLKARTEMTAVIENRRREALRPMLAFVRRILPPSSALAASAIFLIAAIVAAFETRTPMTAGDLGLVAAVAVIAAVVFVSLRTALGAMLLLIAAGRIANWAIDIAGLPAPTDAARVAAGALAAALYLQLLFAWRDRRDPRRKTREAVAMALADSLFAYVAASALAASAMAASEAAGLWSEGVEAALLAAALSLIGLFAAPPLMTAIGAFFGRE